MLWSNESAGTANGLYFASHKDGADDSTASWAGVKLCSSTLCPDDHLNIKSIDADASGNVYAAVKTSQERRLQPRTRRTRSSSSTGSAAAAGRTAPPGRSRTTSPG